MVVQRQAEDDEALFKDEHCIEPPIRANYGFSVSIGSGTFINYSCVIIDIRRVTIGSRTIFGLNVSIYSGTHPLDPAIRSGMNGPESGKRHFLLVMTAGWGGDVKVLAGVTIGDGVTVGAGSVVTKVEPPAL